MISKTAAPTIAGMAMSRLKPTAHARDSPRPSAAAMVRPLRLTPGKGAIIWAMPISRASAHDVCSGPLSPPRSRIVSNSTAAVIRNPIPAAAVLWNAWSIHCLRKRASGTSGRVATTDRRHFTVVKGERTLELLP